MKGGIAQSLKAVEDAQLSLNRKNQLQDGTDVDSLVEGIDFSTGLEMER